MTAYAIRAHSALSGFLVGRAKEGGTVAGLDGDGLPLPCNARMTLDVLVNQLKELDQQVDAIERELPQIHKVNPVAKSLSSIPGICAIAATALVATAPDPTMFSAGREFAAWHGPTPKQNSTGGKDRFAVRK